MLHGQLTNPLDGYRFTVIISGHTLCCGDAKRHQVTLQIRQRGISTLHPGTLTSKRPKTVDSWMRAQTLRCRCFELFQAWILWNTRVCAPKKEQKHEPVRVCVKRQEQGVCQLWLIILIFISHNNKRMPQGELIYPLQNTLHTLFLINLLHLLCFNSFVKDYSASNLSFFSNALLLIC